MDTPPSPPPSSFEDKIRALQTGFHEQQQRSRESAMQAVRDLFADIQGMQAKGYTYADIAMQFELHGIKMNKLTLRTYMRRIRKERSASQSSSHARERDQLPTLHVVAPRNAPLALPLPQPKK